MEKKTVNVKVNCDDCIHKDVCKFLDELKNIDGNICGDLPYEEFKKIISEVELKCKYYKSNMPFYQALPSSFMSADMIAETIRSGICTNS